MKDTKVTRPTMKVPLLVRGYVWLFRTPNPIVRWLRSDDVTLKLAADPDAWVAKTRSFGLLVILAGGALLLGTAFLPPDDRRWLFVGLGLLTISFGVWHRSNAAAIADHFHSFDSE